MSPRFAIPFPIRFGKPENEPERGAAGREATQPRGPLGTAEPATGPEPERARDARQGLEHLTPEPDEEPTAGGGPGPEPASRPEPLRVPDPFAAAFGGPIGAEQRTPETGSDGGQASEPGAAPASDEPTGEASGGTATGEAGQTNPIGGSPDTAGAGRPAGAAPASIWLDERPASASDGAGPWAHALERGPPSAGSGVSAPEEHAAAAPEPSPSATPRQGEADAMEEQAVMYQPTKENSMSDPTTIQSLEQQLNTLYGERESLNERFGVSSFEEISSLIDSLESQLCDLYGRQPSSGGGGDGLMNMLDQIDQISPRLDPSYSQKRVTVTLENSTPVLRAEWIENLK